MNILGLLKAHFPLALPEFFPGVDLLIGCRGLSFFYHFEQVMMCDVSMYQNYLSPELENFGETE